ncbi:MAG: YajQ family cyclic di-GMP-binding protein [Ignavibacteriales bacterium]|nr:YajQ family cyclic di-GMP-binding protein [Ignavibacteriales bacterium]
MASDSSFDIVSKVDFQEVDNALNQARKEIIQRYDFKDSKSSIELKEKEKEIILVSDDEFKMKSVVDIVQSKMIKRGIHLKALKFGTVEQAGNNTVRQVVSLRVGIEKEDAKLLTKMIKDSKLKVNAQIMEDQVRVAGKSKDDLQTAIQLVKNADLPFPVQFANYR